MNAIVIRIVALLALVAGLFAGAAVPSVADPGPPRAIAAKSEPLIRPSCKKEFLRAWHQISHIQLPDASYYYESRRKAMQVMYDQLRWLVADPQAHDLIPGHEAMAARDREAYQPIVARQRDKDYKAVKTLRATYLKGNCLSDRGKDQFKTAMRYLKESFEDIYRAEANLFGMEGAVITAQVDLAGQYLTDADLEYATIDEHFPKVVAAYQQFKHA